jgi:hypothetical protein
MLHSAESNFRQFAAEYLREFETEFENNLGFLTRGLGPVDLWKNQRSKISWDGLFKPVCMKIIEENRKSKFVNDTVKIYMTPKEF